MTAQFNINKYPKAKKYVILYFHVHQPYRLNNIYSPYDIGEDLDYFGGPQGKDDKTIIDRVADLCYRPAGEMFLDLINNSSLKVAYSFTGTLLEQWRDHHPELIDLYRQLADTGKMEVIAETYYHSLASFYDIDEFVRQVLLHKQNLIETFGQTPQVFRNTELTYRNDIGEIVKRLGFSAMFTEGWDPVLDWRSPNYMYRNLPYQLKPEDEATLKEAFKKYNHNSSPEELSGSANRQKIKLLLKDYRRSDDVAFRFQLKGWEGYPVTTEKFAQWVADSPGYLTSLCMDYETVGEHHKADSGIFEFYKHLPEALHQQGIEFILPHEAAQVFDAEEPLDYPKIVSWADAERDLSAWAGNTMQQKSLEAIYRVGQDLRSFLNRNQENGSARSTYSPLPSEDTKLLDTWGKLQTSDHYYYMSTKYWSDGDVHKSFSPYQTPFRAYGNFLNALNDFKCRLHH